MLKKEAPPKVGKGAHRFTVVTDRTPDDLKHAIYQMRYRNMSAMALAKMLGVSPAYVGQLLRGDARVKPRDVYAIRYVLTHSFWDTETNDWIVID